jgi:hypothetical protein
LRLLLYVSKQKMYHLLIYRYAHFLNFQGVKIPTRKENNKILTKTEYFYHSVPLLGL